MKTIFKCEICGSVSETQTVIEQCEFDCKRLELLKSVLNNGDGWNPPITLLNFTKWSKGDQMELLRRIMTFVKKYQDDSVDQITSEFCKKTSTPFKDPPDVAKALRWAGVKDGQD